MIKKVLFSFILFITFTVSKSQTVKLSVFSDVSIITVGSGNELFSAFGHSAIRIKDPMLKMDYVFNYGMFDFNQPNFYTNFAKGRLHYSLGVQKFDYFFEGNRQERRWVKEQVLNLTQDEKQKLFLFLIKNAQPENKDYLYDPFYNNCATKPRDILLSTLDNKVELDTSYAKNPTSLRKLMNTKIHWNTWGSLGINLALGSKLDKEITASEYMYLPDYVHEGFKESIKTTDNSKLVKKENILADFKNKKVEASLLSPLLITSIISLLILLVTYFNYKNKTEGKITNFIILFITGIIGALIAFLWFFTDHKTTPNNFNILWAFAPNLVVAFLSLHPRKWISTYYASLTFLLILLGILWCVGIQLFNYSLLPLFFALGVRYVYNYKLLSLQK